MKILIVSDAWHPQINGVVRTYEYLRKELEDMGHAVKVIGPADFPRSCPMPGYNEIRLVLFPYHRLRDMIESFDADILHIATEGPLGLSARRYATRNSIAFTSCYHTHFPDYAAKRAAKISPLLERSVRALGIKFIRWFHQSSACVFTATKSLETTLQSWRFTAPLKRMTRGVDMAVFYPGEQTLFSDRKRPVALYVGRVAIEKNLEAFLSMDWSGTKIIVGDGPDLPMLQKKYPNALFVGTKKSKDLGDHYRSADVFVFPSRTDTFGMVLIEALACGLPVAGYPVTGPIDIITGDFLGATDEDLAIAAKRATMQGTAEQRVEHVRKAYSWRKAAEQFLDF